MTNIKEMILNTLSDLIDKQNEKGLKNYGQTLEQCGSHDYDWNLMALEESIDLNQYLVKEVLRLQEPSIHPVPEKDLARLPGHLKPYSSDIEILEKVLLHHKLMAATTKAIEEERIRQNEKWGIQRHVHGDWLAILVEEVGEVAQAMQKTKGWGKDTDADNLYEELIHVAAVAKAFAEQVLEEKGGARMEEEIVHIENLSHGDSDIFNLQQVSYKGTYLIPDRLNKYDTIAVVSHCEYSPKNLYVTEISTGKGFLNNTQYEIESIPKLWVLMEASE